MKSFHKREKFWCGRGLAVPEVRVDPMHTMQ